MVKVALWYGQSGALVGQSGALGHQSGTCFGMVKVAL